MRKYPFFIAILTVLMTAALYSGNQIIFYHGNYGMITQSLDLSLEKGLNEFIYENVPAELAENTVMLIPAEQDAFLVQTQSHLKETGRFTDILSQYENKIIEIAMKDGSMISGILFYFDNELVGIEENTGRSLFARVAEIRNFILKTEDFRFFPEARLLWQIRTDRAGTYPAHLSYLSGGLRWSGIYKAVWDKEKLDLEILADISNNTGIDFLGFDISLVAGDPKRVRTRPSGFAASRKMAFDAASEMMAAAPPSFAAETLDEFHVYSYTEPVDLQQAETKQIRLYPPKRIEPEVYYEYFTNSENLLTRLKIINDEKSGLGVPLPRGTIQIYRRNNEEEGLNFVGEDNVEQRPVNEEWIISPGISFDLVGETVVVESRRPTRNITENDMLVKLRNRSKETKSVLVTHNIRGNWTIQRQNHDYEKVDANKIQFRKDMEPDEEYEITWTERIEH